MGNLAQHEKSKHKEREQPLKNMQKRNSYPLRFKAAVLSAVDDLLGYKCSLCSAIIIPGDVVMALNGRGNKGTANIDIEDRTCE